MTLSTAKDMAKNGQFTDAVLNTLRAAGYTDEYIMSVYGWDGGNGGFVSGTGSDYWLGDGSTPSSKTSFNYDEDEGIFTWNGRNYNSVAALEDALNSANLTSEEEAIIKKKLSMFGFNS